MLKPFLGDSLKYLILKAIISIAWIVSLKLFTTLLSPADYGTYSILTAFLAYGLVASTAWLIGPILNSS